MLEFYFFFCVRSLLLVSLSGGERGVSVREAKAYTLRISEHRVKSKTNV